MSPYERYTNTTSKKDTPGRTRRRLRILKLNPLESMIANGDIVYVQQALRSGLVVTKRLLRCALGNARMFRLLLENSSSAELIRAFGDVMIYIAEGEYNIPLEVFDLLLELGVPLDTVNEDGETALMVAVGSYGGDEYVIQQLLLHGADVNARDNEGATAMFMCGYNVPILLAAGADINAQDNEGNTALMDAAGRGYYDGVDTLLKYGADPNIRNKEGKTALWKAQNEWWRYRHSFPEETAPRIIERLQQAGAEE